LSLVANLRSAGCFLVLNDELLKVLSHAADAAVCEWMRPIVLPELEYAFGAYARHCRSALLPEPKVPTSEYRAGAYCGYAGFRRPQAGVRVGEQHWPLSGVNLLRHGSHLWRPYSDAILTLSAGGDQFHRPCHSCSSPGPSYPPRPTAPLHLWAAHRRTPLSRSLPATHSFSQHF